MIVSSNITEKLSNWCNKMTRDQEIAMEILKQLGGRNRLKVMVGGKNFYAVENGVQFKFGLSRKFNTCRILLDENDTYTFELWQITKKRCVMRYQETGLYNDMLVREFVDQTGLELSL